MAITEAMDSDFDQQSSRYDMKRSDSFKDAANSLIHKFSSLSTSKSEQLPRRHSMQVSFKNTFNKTKNILKRKASADSEFDINSNAEESYFNLMNQKPSAQPNKPFSASRKLQQIFPAKQLKQYVSSIDKRSTIKKSFNLKAHENLNTRNPLLKSNSTPVNTFRAPAPYIDRNTLSNGTDTTEGHYHVHPLTQFTNLASATVSDDHICVESHSSSDDDEIQTPHSTSGVSYQWTSLDKAPQPRSKKFNARKMMANYRNCKSADITPHQLMMTQRCVSDLPFGSNDDFQLFNTAIHRCYSTDELQRSISISSAESVGSTTSLFLTAEARRESKAISMWNFNIQRLMQQSLLFEVPIPHQVSVHD